MTKGNQGISSKNVVDKPVRTGIGSKGVSPGWVGQKGQMQGTHTTNRTDSDYRGEQKFTGQNFQPAPFGNEKALDVGKGGCGTGRTLYGQAGSQGTHGATNPGTPRPAGRDILSQFGPDKRSY